MKRRRVILIAVACLVAAVVVAFLVWPGEREPEYQGKKLSEWLPDPPVLYDSDGYPNAQEQDAVRHIGTNALPYLLKWMRYERSGLGKTVAAATAKLPWGLANTGLIASVRKDRAYFRRKAAGVGFAVLGSNAAPAIPQLAAMAADPKLPGAYDATIAMALVGDQGLSPLVAAISNPTHPNRKLAMGLLVAMKTRGVDVSAAMPALFRCLQEADEGVAGSAADTLGDLKLMPEISVPALAQHVHDARENVRVLAIFALGEFGEEGRPPAPALVECLSDTNRMVRNGAANALRKIAPEVLQTNAVIER